MSHAGYLEVVFNRKKQDGAVRKMCQLLKEKNVQFDGFIVTGISGVTIGSIMARSMKKDLVIVRKSEDKSTHSCYRVENYKRDKRYIFLDDLISSGTTFRNIKKAMNAADSAIPMYVRGNKSKIIGGIFYDGISRTTGDGVRYHTIQKLNKL